MRYPRRARRVTLLRQGPGLLLGHLAERDAERGADPALHRRGVRELPGLDEMDHAGVAAGPLLALAVAVDGAGNGPVVPNPVVPEAGGHAIGHEQTPCGCR